jgi:hypothetical protein
MSCAFKSLTMLRAGVNGDMYANIDVHRSERCSVDCRFNLLVEERFRLYTFVKWLGECTRRLDVARNGCTVNQRDEDIHSADISRCSRYVQNGREVNVSGFESCSSLKMKRED